MQIEQIRPKKKKEQENAIDTNKFICSKLFTARPYVPAPLNLPVNTGQAPAFGDEHKNTLNTGSNIVKKHYS
jgi:hypothetical protein